MKKPAKLMRPVKVWAVVNKSGKFVGDGSWEPQVHFRRMDAQALIRQVGFPDEERVARVEIREIERSKSKEV